MFTAFWILWIALFGIIEGIALYKHIKGATLSENVWKYGLPARGSHCWRLRRFLLASFMFWLTLHFLTGGFF